MKFTIYQVDAFTSKLFGGNPAAVIPLQSWPDAELMQQIAMESNLSDTAFFVPNNDGNESSYQIRWFTPVLEVDLCGHATLASAYVIKTFLEPHVQEITFTTQKAGVLKTYVKEGMYTLDFPARIPAEIDAPEKLLQSLGITTAVEILKSRDYFVVLPNEESVQNIEPDFSMMKELGAGVIVTAKGHTADAVSRYFHPGAGIEEDPVTGSAHCNIIPYWSHKLGSSKIFAKQLSKRGGELWCEYKSDRVLISGHCVLYMTGEVSITEAGA
jgi:PhzF family phenazine biosynthesis protein